MTVQELINKLMLCERTATVVYDYDGMFQGIYRLEEHEIDGKKYVLFP